jgi:insertion element IS1 protein InsB
MWHYLDKKAKFWIFKAIDRATGELLAFACGQRTTGTVNKLYEKLAHLTIGHFYTGGFEAFASVFPCHQITQTKTEANAIERHNCVNRHWLARFNRKTIAFSRAGHMVEATMKLLQNLVFHPKADREAWNLLRNVNL